MAGGRASIIGRLAIAGLALSAHCDREHTVQSTLPCLIATRPLPSLRNLPSSPKRPGRLFTSVGDEVDAPMSCPRLQPATCWPTVHRSMASKHIGPLRSYVLSSDSDTRSIQHYHPYTMTADLHLEPACYFSIVPATHFSLETPSITPFSEYYPYTPSDPHNPLLAFRPTPPLHMSSSPIDASRLLQLQTQAAHRPAAEPLHSQSRASSTSSSSSSSSSSSTSRMDLPLTPCCIRCRRECLTSMYQIGTNRYYCSHCARMTGYSAG